jgi:hypothetical protein
VETVVDRLHSGTDTNRARGAGPERRISSSSGSSLTALVWDRGAWIGTGA